MLFSGFAIFLVGIPTIVSSMQMLTQTLAFFATLLVFVPLLFLAGRTIAGTSARTKCALAAVSTSFLLFCCIFRHQDCYRGLDSMMYGNIAKAFRSGVQAVHPDTFFSSVPEDAQQAFLYKKRDKPSTKKGSHDKTFVLDSGNVARPWFMVMHSLVSSALPDGLFVPLLGTIWLAMLFAVCCRGTGVGGICVFLVIVFATPYPLWFFRDDFAEVAGSALVASTLLSHSAKALERPWEFAVVAFLLGFATAFHRSVFLFALPVAILLFADGKNARNRIAVLAGFAVGISALVLETRFVSAPYGDWTQEGESMELLGRYSTHLIPKSLACFLLGFPPAAKSAGILLPALFIAGCFAIFRDKRTGLAWKLLPVVLLLLWFPCINRLGRDEHAGSIVGIWNFRRLFPGVLVPLSLFARPLSGLAAGVLSGKRPPPARIPAPWRNATLLAAAAALCVFSVARNPAAYFAVEGKGSRGIADEVGAELDRLKPDLVVFDYFLHHLPFVFNGRFEVLGIGEGAHADWESAAEWLARVAETQRVVVVSSWTPPPAEKGFSFRETAKIDREYEGVVSKAFMDATVQKRRIVNTILLAECRGAGEPAGASEAQVSFSLPFDGGPLGMRGDWTPAPRGGFWSRPSSGFVGPLPRAGHPVEAVLDLSWTPPDPGFPGRDMTIECPGSSVAFPVGEGRTTNTLVFASNESSEGDAIGEYRVSVTPAFDPGQYGTGGFPEDLGVVFHSVTLRPAVNPPEDGESMEHGG